MKRLVLLAAALALIGGTGLGVSQVYVDGLEKLPGMPVPADAAPPAVANSSALGTTASNMYALWNHTHASKARKDRVLVPVSGVYDVTFSPPAFTGNPLCSVTAETTSGDTNVVNAQIDGATTMTGFRIRVTRTQQSVVALLGLTILSVPTQVATYAHYICIEP